MLIAAPPISKNDESTKIMDMARDHTLPWYDEPIAETAKDLIYKLLQLEPKDRIKAKEIYSHPWMIGYNRFEDVPLTKPELVKITTSDSKEEEEQIINNSNSKKPKQPTPSLSTSVCLEDNQIAMKALNVCNSDSIVEFNRNKSISCSESLSSSRKRKMDFDDDDTDNFVHKPPIKKQKSDPNGLQNEEINPYVFGSKSQP